MKRSFRIPPLLLLASASVLSIGAEAAAFRLTPALTLVEFGQPGPVSFALSMDFGAGEATIGGGLDLALGSFLGNVQFEPSAYFAGPTASTDPAFTGFGTTYADHALEIHFGNFDGLSGQHVLGTVTAVLAAGLQAGQTTTIGLSINSHFGDFYAATPPFDAMAVQLTGAVIQAVPEPRSAWLLLAGLPALLPLLRARRNGRHD